MQKRIKSLAMPKKRAQKSLDKITECFQFNMRDREDVESLSQYLAELRRLTEH